MRLADLLPKSPGLRLQALVRQEARLQVVLASEQKCAFCPDCRQKSKGIHSFYQRSVSDLPWAGIPMKLVIRVRKFFCRNTYCPRKIFTERLGEEMEPYARRTKRSNQQLITLGLLSGGNAGAVLADSMGLSVSASTILRTLHRLPEAAEYEPPRVVGIDDWAFRKGRTYGTILVDLEKGKPIDLLPDRETETVAKWLEAHPSIKIISRDRTDAYAAAARAGAPDAVQVADRWHLLKNLSEALKRLLDKHNKELRAAAVELAKAKGTEVSSQVDQKEDKAPNPEIPPAGREKPLSKYEMNFQEVKRLQAEKHSIHAIARQTGLHRETIKKYFRYKEYPVRAIVPTTLSSAFSFEVYLRKRWDEGERNRKQ